MISDAPQAKADGVFVVQRRGGAPDFVGRVAEHRVVALLRPPCRDGRAVIADPCEILGGQGAHAGVRTAEQI